MRKTMKLGFLMLMAAALAFALGNSALAFHDAATLKCMACHTMHASENGSNAGITVANGFTAAGPTPPPVGGLPYLLVQANEASLCLVCHSESGSAAAYADTATPPNVAPLVQSSGGAVSGDFTIALPGGDYWNSRQTHIGDDGAGGRGHNPGTTDGTDWSPLMPEDDNLDNSLLPPGGSTALTKWDCVSCHAPHAGDERTLYGSANSFRMLWSKPGGGGTAVLLTALEGNLTLQESDANHSAYQSNFSAWCGRCHGNYHEPGSLNYHPSEGALQPADMIGVYNANPETGDNYSFITPVQDGGATTGDFATTAGVAMCLSCHRAHSASSLATHPDYDTEPLDSDAINKTKNMTRWDMTLPSGVGMGCNKCHDKGR